jgi:hypothetical protein
MLFENEIGERAFIIGDFETVSEALVLSEIR